MTILEELSELEDKIEEAKTSVQDAQYQASEARDSADNAKDYISNAYSEADQANDYAENAANELEEASGMLVDLRDEIVPALKQAEETKARLKAKETPVKTLTQAELRTEALRHYKEQPNNRTFGEKVACVASLMYLDFNEVADLLRQTAPA